MITGFQAVMAVNDGGNGGAIGGASTKFNGVITYGLPELEAPTFDATELAQDDGGGTPQPDPFEREYPTGTIKIGKTKGEMKYTKANYQRMLKLCGKRGYTFVLTSPDDLTVSGTPTQTTCQFLGAVTKVGEVVFEKGKAVTIPFEFTASKQPTYS
ncbi:unnamed protein product [Gemmata massiliana]|uniref:Uncharacterized protein n=1 Tax=Gemmata massiliana TaxID=1210884 RepID=A0A6P2D1T2_9BACT|nr:hypothetical protein [Gemmata massiliana]VTR95241.1 unnamed protein product [Gemmata massiliana]